MKLQIENGAIFQGVQGSWRHEQDIIVDVPEEIIRKADELSFEVDANMIVGQDDSGKWTIRHEEDNEGYALRNNFTVSAGRGIEGAKIVKTWKAFLPNGALMGEGSTREEAIEDAVKEYERNETYGDYPRIESRDALVAALDLTKE